MEQFKFSLRNLSRQRRRTVVNLITIAFAVGTVILLDLLIVGTDNDIVKNIIWMGLGHIKIERKGYDEKSLEFPLDRLVDNYESIIERVENVESVTGVSARLISGGILSFKTKRTPVLIEGIETEREQDVSIFSPQSVSGDYIKKGEYGIIIGRELADLMGLKQGNTIFLYARTKDEANNLIDLEVKGIYSIGYASIEKNNVFIPIDIMQILLDAGSASEIVIMLDNEERVEEVKNNLTGLLSDEDVDIFSWKHFAGNIEDIIAMQQGFLQMFRFILLIIALAGIVNTMFMNVWERKKEIGTLRALGYTRGGITSIFLMESFWTGLLGSLIGWLFAFVVGFYLVHYGIPLPPDVMIGMNIPFETTIRGEMHFHQFIGAFFLGIVASLIAGVVPAFRASRIKIIDALREY